jgi:hypothetical protein
MQANSRKTTSLRHLGKVDIAQLREAVLAIPEAVWDAENQNKPNRRYESVGAVRVPVSGRVWTNTRHIIFRFITNQRDWREPADWPLWQEWRERLLPVMEQATRPYDLRACGLSAGHVREVGVGRGNPPAHG